MNTRRNKRNNDTGARDNDSQKEKHTEREDTVTGKNACQIEEQEVEQEGTGYGGNECQRKKQQVKKRKNPQQNRKEFSDSEEDDVNTPISPKTHTDKIESDTKRALTDKQNQRGIEWKVIIVIPILLYIAYNEIRLKGHDTMLKAEFDRTDLITLLDTLNEQVPLLASQMEHIKKDFSPFRIQFIEIQNHMKKINEQTTKLVPEIESLTEKSSKLQTDLLTEKENLEQLTVSVKNVFIQERQIKETLDTLEEPMRKFGDDFNSLARKHTDLDKKINNSISSTEKITKRIVTSETKLYSMADTIDKYENKYETVEQVIAESENFQRELEELTYKTKETDEKVVKTNTTITNLQREITNSKSVLSDVIKKTHEMKTEWEGFGSKQEMLDKDISSSKQKMITLKTYIESQLKFLENEVKEKTMEIKRVLTNVNEDMSESKKRSLSLKDNILHMNSTLKIIRNRVKRIKHIDNCEEKITSVSSKFENLLVAVADLESMKEYTLHKLPNVDARLMTIEELAPFIQMTFGVGILEILVLLFLAIRIYIPTGTNDTLRQTRTLVSKSPRNRQEENNPYQAQCPLTLESNICVLSFNKEAQILHLSLVTSVIEDCGGIKSKEIVPFHVMVRGDIPNIPKCRYFFIFVDNDASDIFLDNKDSTTSDMKVAAVEAALQTKAKIFFILVGDNHSRNLFQGQLYNPELLMFTTHPVLRKLEEEGKCFSIFEHFNKTQKEHIQQIIN